MHTPLMEKCARGSVIEIVKVVILGLLIIIMVTYVEVKVEVYFTLLLGG